MIAKTPETDKMYDMVSDREAPNYNMVGHLPSKWSYEAILDLTDFARRLERQRDAALELLQAFVDANPAGGATKEWAELARAVLREIEGKS